MRHLRTRWALIVAAVVVVGVVAFLTTGSRPSAMADDASHTTTLATGNYNFGTGAGSESAVIATLVSTSSSDVFGTIYISRKPSGGSTYTVVSVVKSPTDATMSGVDTEAAVTIGEFTSGDSVQARFYCYDSSSAETFSYTRTITIP
jgi:hypothetical protein